ncbi:hypothetical protein SGCZBJ_24745 [Caulobacter zeae]|uniref:Glycosyltransferase subfamily 4-like N-terminal domain-containing protein n=1 Tax=Caulobacter zeae TaxID=2055137 RepID=A0A2N5CYF4_9CAUL|nr:glycosyltransferase [Caulobacter zeae]PLR18848.1 hypothetical protein SGCZBJ_24745 [Caulobacter zeae]
MPRVLSLSTYPVVRPIHGGQRRIHAFSQRLAAGGWEFVNASVYDPDHYSGAAVGPDDLPLRYVGTAWRGLPLVGDLQAGEFAATSPEAYAHFARLVERLAPDFIQLEQPFLWPLVKRLRAEGVAPETPVIYSSQNWEAPLKYKMLVKAGAPEAKAREVAEAITALERELSCASAAIVAVSESDAEHYRAAAPDVPVFVVPNGVSRPVTPTAEDERACDIYEGRKYLLFVGSAYPPNIEGFLHLLLKNGLFFFPPEKSVAICGGVSHGIFGNGVYQAQIHANSRRCQFFADVSDGELEALKRGSHAVILPIQFGGGSNLKTAEALASGRWVVATSIAMRGFERFANAPGVLVADTPDAFRDAIVKVLASPPLKLTAAQAKARESVYWDRCFDAAGYIEFFDRQVVGA